MNVYGVTLHVIGKLHTQSGSFSFLFYFLISKRIIPKKKDVPLLQPHLHPIISKQGSAI